jgi:MOSC domain-containing protein YiiM
LSAHQILAILSGKAQPFRADEQSAIAKAPREGPVAVGMLGLEGDEQADLAVHGGPDKALHHYPSDHYPFWRGVLGEHPLLGKAGAFGENIATLGLTEREVCLGDRFRLGSALIEVSQGRQPCWKQGHRLSNPSVVALIVAYRFSGWYYRVLEPGMVAAGNNMELVERPLPEWDIERVFGLLIGGDGADDPAALRALAGFELLATPWRTRAANLLAQIG